MKPTLTLLTALLFAPLAALQAAELKLPSIFSDHMVLQSGKAVPVWGWADAGERVAVEFAGQSKSTTANADGKWTVKLDPLAASGESREMRLSTSNGETRVIRDVIVGEVWLGSGQSNLGVEMGKLPDYEKEVATASNPLVREYMVIPTPALDGPRDDCPGFWRLVRPGSTPAFSALGYFFIKDLHRELATPVAFLNDCWGGTRIEPWLSAEAVAALPTLAAEAASEKDSHGKAIRAMEAWLKQTGREDRPVADTDAFTIGPVSPDDGWIKAPNRDEIDLPGVPKHGVFWFRRQFQGATELRNAPQRLLVAPFAMFEKVYWNGRLIGGTDYANRTTDRATRWHYYIPPDQIRDGVNELAVRAFAPVTPPGFAWPPALGGRSSPGEWSMKVERALPPLDGLPPAPPLNTRNLGIGSLFNGMIHPVLPYGIRGAVWYQGESNTRNPQDYRERFPALIRDWRRHWNAGEFPFYFCQLANFRGKATKPGESAWAELREAQSLTLALPNTGMAVLIDTGESGDIHPLAKDVAGSRLARIALAKTYGKAIPFSGPVYEAMKVEGDRIRLTFRHLEGGLVAKEVPATYDVMRKTGKTAPLVRNSPQSQLEGFAICGADKKWVWADANIDGDTVLVSAKQVPAPIAVRYAWSDNPTCNLYNAADLPAPPFRTDDFEFAAASPQSPAKPSDVSKTTLSNQPASPPAKQLSTTPTPRVDNPGWMKIVEWQAAAAKPGRWDLVLIGDSITAGWQSGTPSEIWAKYFSAYRTLNLGISADKTENVLWRLAFPGTLGGYKPKLFVLMIGTNNTGHRYGTETADDTARGIRAILDKLAAKAPEAKILLLAIFPRGEEIKRKRNDEVNRKVEKLADNKQVFWLNLNDHFLQSDGTLSKQVFKDEKPYPIHLTAEGYEAWAQAMQQKIKELTK